MDVYIVWFRQDLRMNDNLALSYAAEQGNVLPIYILDDQNADEWAMGAASRVWLHHSLMDLNASLDGHLSILKGNPLDILISLCKEHNIKGVYWGRCYEPWRIERDTGIKQALISDGIEVKSFNHSLLWEPWEVSKKDKTPYKVFTPYYRKGCRQAPTPRQPQLKPANIEYTSLVHPCPHLNITDLLPTIDWHTSMLEHWEISESGAHERLEDFLAEGINNYKAGRDFPAKDNVSKLAAYLHFGQLSPNQVWYTVQHQTDLTLKDNDTEHFLSEIAWREFSYSLLYYNPEIPKFPLQDKFNHFVWDGQETHLKAWKTGQTGFPIVDAGMRELWQTGYMHNRVRMIVASFLIKNLLIDWRTGERWFWDCLFDADLANNAASWQWVAGCGADASPYFRIFNPVTQSEKFDPDGKYIRQYVPELSKLDNKHIHKPWMASEQILNEAGIKLDKDYPYPIIDLKVTRERALLHYKGLSNN